MAVFHLKSTLKAKFKEWYKSQHPPFHLARITNSKFGIVDPDRARFPGISFNVDLLSPTGGCACLHFGTEDSLEIIKKHGSAEALNNELCWVHCEGIGMATVNFVCMAGEEAIDLVYGEEDEETRS